MTHRKKIAIVGAGVAGLGAAYALKDAHDVTLFEKDARLGGHANTVRLDHDGRRVDVDAGFIVFNEANYPNLCALFSELGVASRRADMSFGFSEPGGVEWCSNLSGVFAQKRNLASPAFIGMLLDMARFNRVAARDLKAGLLRDLELGHYLDLRGFGEAFRKRYLLPMGAAIWSSTETEVETYPAQAFIRFFDNHRLMHAERPKWRTVTGGSQTYVDRLEAALTGVVRRSADVCAVRRMPGGVLVRVAGGRMERFDDVILACHSDEALEMLEDASQEERFFLGAIGFALNRAVVHRDPSFMPVRRGAWAAWNFFAGGDGAGAQVTYDMNRLQGIPRETPVFLTLNPGRAPDPRLVFEEFDYAHPQFDVAALAAQRRFNLIQGVRNTWFAGAWLGYGFHEDGLRSGLRVALRLGGRIGWDFVEGDVDGGQWGAPEPFEHRMAAAE